MRPAGQQARAQSSGGRDRRHARFLGDACVRVSQHWPHWLSITWRTCPTGGRVHAAHVARLQLQRRGRACHFLESRRSDSPLCSADQPAVENVHRPLLVPTRAPPSYIAGRRDETAGTSRFYRTRSSLGRSLLSAWAGIAARETRAAEALHARRRGGARRRTPRQRALLMMRADGSLHAVDQGIYLYILDLVGSTIIL